MLLETNILLALGIAVVSIFTLLNLLRSRLSHLFGNEPDNLKKLIGSQASLGLANQEEYDGNASDLLINSIEEAGGGSRLKVSLTRKFRLAGWIMSIPLFYAFEISISLMFFSLASLKFNVLIQLAAVFTGPLLMHWFLSRSIDARFKRFDADYAQFLMQVVGLLKTGMTAMTAIHEASKGLDFYSLVRSEVRLMIDRVRFGMAEEKSIGAFGEDINHPEIELFVQALLLSRRLGGGLSDTLERLSKQVRKRQYFRNSAEAAIGLQRGSLWLIIILLLVVEGFIAALYPDLIFKAIETELGWQVWQVCFLLIGLAFVWIRQVTRIKI